MLCKTKENIKLLDRIISSHTEVDIEPAQLPASVENPMDSKPAEIIEFDFFSANRCELIQRGRPLEVPVRQDSKDALPLILTPKEFSIEVSACFLT